MIHEHHNPRHKRGACAQCDVMYILGEMHSAIGALMSAITNFRDKVEANFGEVKTAIKALFDKIDAFNNSPGELTPEDQAAVDEILADSKTLADQAKGVVPPVPPGA